MLKLLAFIVLSITSFFLASSVDKEFKKTSEALAFLLESQQVDQALDLGLNSLKFHDNPCSDPYIFLWTASAAKKKGDYSLTNSLLEDGLSCDPSILILWQELFLLLRSAKGFNPNNFLFSARKSLSSLNYKILWNQVRSYFPSELHKPNFSFKVQPIFSNNYNNGLIVDRIELFNLPFRASEESKSLEGFGLEISSYTSLKLIDEPFYSLGFSLAVEASDYPSYKGDTYSVQAGLNYGNFSLSYPIQLRYVFVKRNFANDPLSSSNYLIFNLGNLNKTYIDSFNLTMKERKYEISKFQDGKGLEFSFKINLGQLTLSPGLDFYEANQDTYSYKGKSISFELLEKANFKSHIVRNNYKDFFAVFGKKRLDKAYGISLKLKLPKLLNKKYFPEISYFKVNSNIGIFDTRRLEFKLNF